jgi:hypothetical protein
LDFFKFGQAFIIGQENVGVRYQSGGQLDGIGRVWKKDLTRGR